MVMILLAIGCESAVVEEVVLSLQGLTQQKHISPNQPLQWNTTPMPTQNVEINIYIKIVLGKQKWFVNSWLKVYVILSFININIYSRIFQSIKQSVSDTQSKLSDLPEDNIPMPLLDRLDGIVLVEHKELASLSWKKVARVLWKRRARDVEILGATLAPPTPSLQFTLSCH